MTEFQIEKVYEDGEWLDKKAILLSPGVKLVLLRHSREMAAQFRYSDPNFTFDFTAWRWDERLIPMDHWEVQLGLALQHIQSETITLDDAWQIAHNIEAMLLKWPSGKVEAQVPIREVRFLMTPWKLWTPEADPYLTTMGGP